MTWHFEGYFVGLYFILGKEYIMYVPSKEILYKYADVMVNFGVNNGKGVKKGENIFVYIPECAKPFLIPLQETILKAGAHPVIRYLPDGIARHFYEHANDEQLVYLPEKYKHGEIQAKRHHIGIIADTDKHELSGIDSKKIMTRIKANKPYREMLNKKEVDGNFSWTVCLYGTEAVAKEVGLSLEEYWEQIVEACFLDHDNPVQKWKDVQKDIDDTIEKLNKLNIKYVHVQGEDIDLKIKIGDNRQRLGGRGCNIPSFEIFTSPDWRETEGWIKFNQPLYRYGSLIEGIELNLKNGLVTKTVASKNEHIIKEMVAIENMDKLGEFSLTDKRLSRITKFMGETLYDENVGGDYGNTHIALGAAYKDTYTKDKKIMEKKDWENLGFNDCMEHVDMISTTDRVVTATLADGSERVIYKDGMFSV